MKETNRFCWQQFFIRNKIRNGKPENRRNDARYSTIVLGIAMDDAVLVRLTVGDDVGSASLLFGLALFERDVKLGLWRLRQHTSNIISESIL